jgi:hypothetical protein
MAKIYNVPEGIEVPSLDVKDIRGYDAKCDKFRDDIKQWLKDNGWTGKHSGVSISFPVADGYAEYIVVSLKPVQLIHIPVWDAWHYPQAEYLTAKEINDKIDSQERLAKLFPPRVKK